jgi:hypothetical protein
MGLTRVAALTVVPPVMHIKGCKFTGRCQCFPQRDAFSWQVPYGGNDSELLRGTVQACSDACSHAYNIGTVASNCSHL